MTGPIHSRCIEDPFKTVRFQSLFILNAATQFDRVIERLPNLVNRAELPLRVVNSRLGATPIFKTASLIACHRILGARHWRPTFVSVLNRKGATTPSSRIQLHFDAERDTVLLSAKLACKSKNIISVNFITGMVWVLQVGSCSGAVGSVFPELSRLFPPTLPYIVHKIDTVAHMLDLAESICYESGLWNHFSTNCCTIAQSQGRGSPPPATSATTLFFNMYMPSTSSEVPSMRMSMFSIHPEPYSIERRELSHKAAWPAQA
ncbi:hypothetical protein EV360DRAFT_65476 [Lentinula raphanica]|nr:hypothetical protein EV360DRAFT_65476 [Lentinula raphanica]